MVRRIAHLIGAVLFAASAWYIARTFEWATIVPILGHVDAALLIVGGGATMMVYWMVRALRWHILLKRTGTVVPFLDLYACTAASLSLAPFTPLQSGEMLKIEMLKKHGLIRRSPGYGSFLVERALDLATVLAIACVSLLTTFDLLSDRSHAYYLLAALALACAAGGVVLHRARPTGRIGALVGHMRESVGDAPTLLVVLLTTWVSWACVVVTWQVLLASGSMHLGFAKTLSMMAVVALISILSLIPGGLGIAEVGTSQILMSYGLAPAPAQAGTLLLRSYSLIALVLGAVHFGCWTLAGRRRRERLGMTETHHPRGL